MVTRRKYLSAVAGASAVGTVSMAGCLGGDGGGTTQISAATVFNEDHIQARILKRGVENFIEASDNDYELDLLAGSIGGEEDQMESAATGDIQMHSTSFGGLTNRYAGEYGFVSAPFVAQGWEHLQAIEEEYVHGDDGFNQELIDGGDQRILGGAYRGIRHTTSNKEVHHPDDLKDVPMRLPEIDSWIQPWDEIGVDVTPVQADELYSALETGVIEASEGPIGQFVDFSLYEVQTHFSQTGHMTQAYAQVVNEEFWGDLSDDDKDNLDQAVQDAIDWGYDTLQGEFDEMTQMVQDEHGTTVVKAEDIDQEAFQQAAEPAIQRLFEEEWLADYDDVRNLA